MLEFKYLFTVNGTRNRKSITISLLFFFPSFGCIKYMFNLKKLNSCCASFDPIHTFSSIIVPRLVCVLFSVFAFYCFNWNMCLPNVYTYRTKKLHANLHFQTEEEEEKKTHTQNRLNVHLRFNLCLWKANKIAYSGFTLFRLFLLHLFGYDRRCNNIFRLYYKE